VELDSAYAIGKAVGVVEHSFIRFNLHWGGSALTDLHLDVPDHMDPDVIPITYVPARNSIFLSLAMSYAEAIGAVAIYAGMNAVDYSGYPDCRPEFIEAMEEALNRGTRQGVEGGAVVICTPLLHLSKQAIVELGETLHVPFGLTWSCYKGGDKPCGVCDSCRIRDKAFRDAGMEDPLWTT
jgi:7-cyano-7-deazaguanine synthase